MRTGIRLGVLAGIGLALAIALPSAAQDYPTRPITIVVPYAAGGATDVATRLVASKLAPIVGGSVVVENKPGAATILGAETVARAPKDGYTLLMSAGSTFSTNPHMYKKLSYKLEDFDAVSLITKLPYVINVAGRVPAKNVAEYIAYAKSKPDGVTYGTTGTGSSNHVLGILVAEVLGIKMQDVPYKGDAPARADLVAGTLDSQMDSMTGSLPLHRAGTTRIIGILDDARWPTMPDVPTFAEQGWPNAKGYTWFALMAPAGTPKPVVTKLNAAVAKVMEMEDVRQKFIEGGQLPMPMSPENTAKFIKEDYDRWGAVIRKAGIQLD